MVKKYLLDTCVWRDFYEDRFSKSGKPLGKYATKLFMKILFDKDKILFSEALIEELMKDYVKDKINDMLYILFATGALVKIGITKEEFLEAKVLAKERSIPFIDYLNTIQARNHKAIMVSQDRHFFKNLSDLTDAVRPQEII